MTREAINVNYLSSDLNFFHLFARKSVNFPKDSGAVVIHKPLPILGVGFTHPAVAVFMDLRDVVFPAKRAQVILDVIAAGTHSGHMVSHNAPPATIANYTREFCHLSAQLRVFNSFYFRGGCHLNWRESSNSNRQRIREVKYCCGIRLWYVLYNL